MKVTLNGKIYEAEPGQTILDVARANGINIPTLCYLPELSPFGACRVCLVEVEKITGSGGCLYGSGDGWHEDTNP